MPAFQWSDTDHNITLAKEVISCRPSKPLDRDSVASRLNAVFATEEKPVELKGRGCRERLDRSLYTSLHVRRFSHRPRNVPCKRQSKCTIFPSAANFKQLTATRGLRLHIAQPNGNLKVSIPRLDARYHVNGIYVIVKCRPRGVYGI